MVPLIGAAGVSIDYLRAARVQTAMQAEADATTLAVAASKDNASAANWLENYKSGLRNSIGHDISNMAVSGSWISATDFKITADADVAVSLMAIFPGLGDKMHVSVKSVARVKVTAPLWKTPTVSQLDYEAADYNRIYVYCYDADKKNNVNGGRSQETAIADNGGTTYTFQMPHCGDNETLSYRLYNVRNMRVTPANWNNPNVEHYNWYSNTKYTNGVESYDFAGYALLENVLCDSLAACKPQSQGGIIPEGRNRTPQRAASGCVPGKYMYYGWEDRPPGMGWTDQDYDDIRIIVECPAGGTPGQTVVRLIQ